MKIEDYSYFKESGLIIPSDLMQNPNSAFRDKFQEKFLNQSSAQFSSLPGYKVSDRDLTRPLGNLSSMVLETTEDCNLSCRYCFYSKNYLDQRKKTKKEMSLDTAESSLKFFFDWIIDNYSYRKDPMSFEIAFYGGEPTLNFKLIEFVVSETKSIVSKERVLRMCNPDIIFNITTNGKDLEDKIDFFIENEFYLTFSLDGPELIHDGNRGKGSFSEVFSMLEYVFRKNPTYFRDAIKINIVFTRNTDLNVIVDFFSQELFEEVLNINFLEVNPNGLLESGLINLSHEYEDFFMSLMKKAENKIPLKKVEKSILSRMFQLECNNIKNYPGKPPGIWCVPGSVMLYVTCDGDFYGCEKVSRSFKIGDVSRGFDFE